MKIALSLIQGSPSPVRTTWDEEKLNELAQSLKEQGLIQPIKVRLIHGIKECTRHGFAFLNWDGVPLNSQETEPCFTCVELRAEYANCFDDDGDEIICDGYEDELWDSTPIFEIVYGHRRVEAARRAGFDWIETLIEDLDDQEALIQALIENLQREDMTSKDIALGLRALKDVTGWSNMEIERRGIIGNGRAAQLLNLLEQSPEILNLLEPRTGFEPITERHVREVRQVINDDSLKMAVLKKAQEEQLSSAQTRRVAESVAAAPGEHAKQVLIDQPYSQFRHDPEFIKDRADKFGAHDPIYSNTQRSHLNEDWQSTPEVSNVIALMRSWMGSLTEFRKADELGKMSPEARGFVGRRVRQFAEALIEWADKLEDEGE